MVLFRALCAGLLALTIGCEKTEVESDRVSESHAEIRMDGGILTRVGDEFVWLQLPDGTLTNTDNRRSAHAPGFGSPFYDQKESKVLFHAGSFPSAVYSVALSSLDVTKVVANAEEPTISGDRLYVLRRSNEMPPIILVAEANSPGRMKTAGSLEFYTIGSVLPVGQGGLFVASTNGDRRMIRGSDDQDIASIWERILAERSCIPVVVREDSGFALCGDSSDGGFYAISADGEKRLSPFNRGSLVAYDGTKGIAYIIVDRGSAPEQSLVHDLYALRVSDMEYQLVSSKIKPFVSGIWLPERPAPFLDGEQ